MHRRTFLSILAAGASAFALNACAAHSGPQPVPSTPDAAFPTRTLVPAPAPTLVPTLAPAPVVAVPNLVQVSIPEGVMTALPGTGKLLAWTVDDGSNSDVVRLYTQFAHQTGTRLTFFLNGSYPAWTEHADLLKPLVASGQIQLGNHTFSHADLTSLSDDDVVRELQRNHDFIVDTYGVDPRPFYRPPYGYRDHRTDRLAASIGYTTPVLWHGSLSDSGHITEQQVVDFATQWFLPEHIVIGHLNFLPVTNVFPQLHRLITDRGLTTVTLNDVFTH